MFFHDCGANNEDNATVCWKCGQPILRPGSGSPQPPSTPPRNCPNCGTLTDNPETVFCGNCGTKLPVLSPAATQAISRPLQQPTPPAQAPQRTPPPPPLYPRQEVKTTSSSNKALYVVLGSFGVLLALCMITGLGVYFYAEYEDSKLTPEQRVQKALQSSDRNEIEIQLQKTPKGTRGREEASRHLFDTLKKDALASQDPDEIRSILERFTANSTSRNQIEAHLNDVARRQQQAETKTRQEEQNAEAKSVAKDCAPMSTDKIEVIGDTVLYTIREFRDNNRAAAGDICTALYQISCKIPQIKYVKFRYIFPADKLIDKYGNEMKEDLEICTLQYETDPIEAPKYKDEYLWRTESGIDRLDLIALDICKDQPMWRTYYKCD